MTSTTYEMTERQDTETEISPEIKTSSGFITAFWASGGLAILGSFALDRGLSMLSSVEWATMIPFVIGVYASSYVFGKILARERIRKNIFWSILVAFVVSELVLFGGSVFGGVGYVMSSLIEGKNFEFVIGEAFGGVFGLPILGVMFTLPLSVALGTNIRLAERVRAHNAYLDSREEERSKQLIAEGF